MGIIKRNSRKKAKQLLDNHVIDLDEKKLKRRQELRANAGYSRNRRGEKSIQQQILDEVAADDLHIERDEYLRSYSLSDVIAEQSGAAAINSRGTKSKKKKPMNIYMKILIAVAVFVFLALLMSIGQIISLKIQEADAEKRVAMLREQREKLEAQTAEIGSDENIEKQARSWLKMAKQGETLYIIGNERGRNISEAEKSEASG